jgi:hypothetical protein
MKNKNKKKEFFMDVDNNSNNPDNNKEIGDNSQNQKNTDGNLNTKNNSSKLAGINEKFPEENFVQIYSKQNSKKIKLNTYRYPAKGNLKGVVYLL